MRSEKLESILKKLRRVDLSRSESEDTTFLDTEYQEWIPSGSTPWECWLTRTKYLGIRSEDRIRAAIYFGIQPLYDLLLDANLDGEKRKEAMNLFSKLLNIGQRHLTNYYLGKFNKDVYRKDIFSLDCLVSKLKDLPWNPKQRFNEETQNGYTIQEFLQSALELYQELFFKPDVLICCASSAIEQTLVLSKLLNLPYGLIRFSAKRGDKSAIHLPEDTLKIKELCQNKNVAIIEDFSETGNTLEKVTAKVKKYKPIGAIGLTAYSGLFNKFRYVLRKPHLDFFQL